ncbi:type I glutamate--ammonia ligase [Neoehrlichia mikurensis]|uniref:Glutamine synthetase n=1 Tax=Neoehrlichia mikurensis TaxID=89586 RepID=A0A9Q9F622_9RICK|nr:type I glutamate--ammonia ligase [Neoehrlichia mikurensis]QXK92276.1 type I glutamate--ammonia ligase [Neoehrlichia mikurensis]QXK92730.1 type I glutamate--ammonia ligase [Neoehrlichia mikurensis]QXK93971.1 type I glutamate--ammonia ligase [Neoehrlichia mikurensis]UTO55866.1 type I glutamate--ammonia ligase [Neoehrlichia mikurensis]UTO56782.1 type I glutamate--ammonia ligase [Neoehrlichia mikurensis]
MFLSIEDFLNYINKHSIKFIDLRFSDLLGKWYHITRSVSSFDVSTLSSGISFDSSSIPGWQSIEKSDMVLFPDVKTSFIDPFCAQPTIVIICDVINTHNQSEYSKDPRYTAKKAYQYLLSTSIANKCYFGPEIEFFVFDDVKFNVNTHQSCFKLMSSESNTFTNNDQKFYNNNGYYQKPKSGYMPIPPVDALHDIRSEMLTMLSEVGIIPLLHHHEVAPSQCEIGFQYDELVSSADNVQKCKYVIRNVANSYNKTATFMPKPIYGDNGNGMHCHQSLWKDGANIFVNKDGNLSDTCLYYIGGIIKYGKAINAFSNPSTNSYKRLVPNFEAPTFLVYSYENRSAAIRIPYVPKNNMEAKRIEVRFPDPLANPYLCFASQLMAGLHGIKNKIDPGAAFEKNLYTLDNTESSALSAVAGSLEESLLHLDNNRGFLLEGNVFTNEQIDSYIKLKKKENQELNSYPHPIEFINYYSL